jgi:arylsulfatase A
MKKIFLLCLTLHFTLGISAQNKTKKPNIIYILADDLGYGDVSCLNENSKIKTTHIDALAQGGMKFTDAHSNSAVCTPTRYGILTGRYAWRSRMKSGVLWSYDTHLIEPERLTAASLLKKQGYQTACVGKWHLGMDWSKEENGAIDFTKPIENTPTANGFDYFYGITASLDIPPYFYIKNDRITATKIDSIDGTVGKGFWRNGPIGDDFKHEEVLSVLTQKALDFIQKQDKNKPYFLYFPLPAPHTPILPTKEYLGKSGTNEYGDFVLMVDDVVGQIMAAVKEKGEENNTIIIFTSDNGCSPMADFKELAQVGHNPSYVFRGTKADIFEGGHHVPFIVHWKGHVKPQTVTDKTICLTDFIATCADIVNEKLPDNAGEDSYSLLPLLTDKPHKFKRKATVLHSVDGYFAIQKGKWKLEMCAGSGGWSAPKPGKEEAGLPPIQLYNLENDIGETKNVQAAYPSVVKELTTLLTQYIKDGRSTKGTPQKNDGMFLEKPMAWMKE